MDKQIAVAEETVVSQKRNKQSFGRQGEAVARQFLEAKGWTIIDYNWRAGRKAEIDIVAIEPSGVVVFVEVKTRRTYDLPDDELVGFSAIQGLKQHKVIKAALRYLARHELSVDDVACRLDVIVVHYKDHSDTPEVLHVPDAFHQLSWHVDLNSE